MHLQPIVTALCSWPSTRRRRRAVPGHVVRGMPSVGETKTERGKEREGDTEMRIRCRGAVALSRLVVKPRDEFPWTGNVSC